MAQTRCRNPRVPEHPGSVPSRRWVGPEHQEMTELQAHPDKEEEAGRATPTEEEVVVVALAVAEAQAAPEGKPGGRRLLYSF